MHDIIQDSPIFQEILREGMEKGLEQGQKRGFEQGRLEASRRILLILTEKHFPALISLAQERAASIQDLDVFDKLIVAITSAQNELEASNALQGHG